MQKSNLVVAITTHVAKTPRVPGTIGFQPVSPRLTGTIGFQPVSPKNLPIAVTGWKPKVGSPAYDCGHFLAERIELRKHLSHSNPVV